MVKTDMILNEKMSTNCFPTEQDNIASTLLMTATLHLNSNILVSAYNHTEILSCKLPVK